MAELKIDASVVMRGIYPIALSAVYAGRGEVRVVGRLRHGVGQHVLDTLEVSRHDGAPLTAADVAHALVTVRKELAGMVANSPELFVLAEGKRCP